MTLSCPTPCDDDCEADCHEAHLIPRLREHCPDRCPAAGTWVGEVIEVRRTWFTAKMTRRSDGREVWADYPITALPVDGPLEVGLLFFAPEMRPVPARVWSAEELAEIQERAEERLAALLPLIGCCQSGRS